MLAHGRLAENGRPGLVGAVSATPGNAANTNRKPWAENKANRAGSACSDYSASGYYRDY